MATLLETIEQVTATLSRNVTCHYADLDEANSTIVDRLKKSQFPVMLIIPFTVQDAQGKSGLLQSSTELQFYLLDKNTGITVDFKARDVENMVITPMRVLARELVQTLDRAPIINQVAGGIVRATYQPVYSSLDAHLFGVFVRVTVPFIEPVN